ncbi:hypothetical protein AVEN_60405-1 [Araneus ventricosus]|uniref:Uncharacterized protein n=1 Tax=Araneus ventricosus TaxID=182803 RepID=A0A4Y2H369_ARAVE|nr:hypothetical protein AVEN_60405-1 [Araneus ventricosus]
MGRRSVCCHQNRRSEPNFGQDPSTATLSTLMHVHSITQKCNEPDFLIDWGIFFLPISPLLLKRERWLALKPRSYGLSFHEFRPLFALFPIFGTGRIDVARGLEVHLLFPANPSNPSEQTRRSPFQLQRNTFRLCL